MLTLTKGNLFERATLETDVIIHGCNCQGVMASGFAKTVRQLYPNAYDAYMAPTSTGRQLGTFSYSVKAGCPTVVNLLTQQTYGRDPAVRYVSYDAVDVGLRSVVEYFGTDVKYHIPFIGAKLGNGDKRILLAIFDVAFAVVDATLWLHDGS